MLLILWIPFNSIMLNSESLTIVKKVFPKVKNYAKELIFFRSLINSITIGITEISIIKTIII